MKPGAAVAMILLALIGILHLLRVLLGIPITVGITTIPMWASLAATVIACGISVLLWRESHSAVA